MAMKNKSTLAALLLLLPVIHCSALAQHSASASVTVRFTVLPEHTGATGAISAGAVRPNGPVSNDLISVGITLPSGASEPHILATPGSPFIRPPRGSSLVVTVTD